MGNVVLHDLRMTIDSRSYIDAMHAILSHQGWISCSKSMLSGMTVTGFRFAVNRRLTAESPTAYNWIAENFLAADFLGIASAQHAGYSFDATFPLYRQHAISIIKESIDCGVGAVFWKDRFVVAAGYDDERQILYYSDGYNKKHQMLSYTDFGNNRSPYWYYQVLKDRIQLDEAEIYKESFLQAIYKWEAHDRMLPEAEYACGRLAYDAIVQAFLTGDYDRNGAWETLWCYAAAKRDIALYTGTLQRIWPESGAVGESYTKLAQIFGHIIEETELSDSYQTLSSRQVRKLVDLFTEAKLTEEQAIQSIKMLLRETIGNRFNDIALR